jgi:hypothetical protein
VVILSAVISLVIVLALVMVPLALIARLSVTVLTRLLGGVSQSEVATRAEFARIREQLLATAGDGDEHPEGRELDVAAAHLQSASEPAGDRVGRATLGVAPEPALAESAELQPDIAPNVAEWRRCPTCAADVASTARICLQCGAGLNERS